MSKKLYALTDREASELRRLVDASQLRAWAEDDPDGHKDTHYLMARLNTPLDHDAAVERMARAIADLEPGEPWPTNAELGGGLTGTRDDEFWHDCMDHARAVLAALLGSEQGGTR